MQKHYFILLLLSAFVLGCGPKNPYDTVLVEGIVTLDGAPVPEANVIFNPLAETGVTAGGMTTADGKFVLTTGMAPFGSGAIPGEYNVALSKMTYEDADLPKEEFDKKYNGRDPKRIYVIPQRYGNPAASGIGTITVSRDGENNFTFELKSK